MSIVLPDGQLCPSGDAIRGARYFHRDEPTIVREVGQLEERLQEDKQGRRRLAAIVKQLSES